MATSHSLIGALLAVPLMFIYPEFSFIAVSSGFLGGLFPDLDVLFEHRKTMHFPIYYSLLVLPALVLLVVNPGLYTVAGFCFISSAAVHSVMDIFGSGPTARPWSDPIDKAVYNHFRGFWFEPRRRISYSGSPGDFAISFIGCIVSLYVLPSTFVDLIYILFAASLVWFLLRKRIPDLIESYAS